MLAAPKSAKSKRWCAVPPSAKKAQKQQIGPLCKDERPYPNLIARSRDLANQLFARKSIDKLITESEEPEHRLKKTLGPWSLTALGIGAVIGSGIFTVIGTAIAGQTFEAKSILNAPVLEYLIHHSATFGRPGAGSAIALSFILVAGSCGLSTP